MKISIPIWLMIVVPAFIAIIFVVWRIVKSRKRYLTEWRDYRLKVNDYEMDCISHIGKLLKHDKWIQLYKRLSALENTTAKDLLLDNFCHRLRTDFLLKISLQAAQKIANMWPSGGPENSVLRKLRDFIDFDRQDVSEPEYPKIPRR